MTRRALILAPLALPALAVAPAGGLRFPGLRRQHEAALRAAYALLPARGKEHLIEVLLYPRFEWTLAEAWRRPGIGGLYVPGVRRRIFLLESDRVTTTANFSHEAGHHLESLLTREERLAWAEFWAANLALMPRAYSRTSATEGFCDSYASVYVPEARRVFGAVGADVAGVVRELCEGGQL